MIEPVRIGDTFGYDQEVSLSLYRQYLDGDLPVNELLTYLYRFVVIALRDSYPRTPHTLMEDLAQEALLRVWTTVERRLIPSDAVGRFHGYMRRIVTNAAAKVFREEEDLDKLDSAWYDADNIQRRFSSAWDVENKLFIEDLPRVVRSRVLFDFRFPDPDRREAAAYIIDCLFAGKRIVRKWLEVRYNISDPDFVIDHVCIRVRMALWGLREQGRLVNRPDRQLALALEDFYATSSVG